MEQKFINLSTHNLTPYIKETSAQTPESITKFHSVKQSTIRLEQSLIPPVLDICRTAFEEVGKGNMFKRYKLATTGMETAQYVAKQLGENEIFTQYPAAIGYITGWLSLDHTPKIIKQIEKIACGLLNQQNLHHPSFQLLLSSISGMAVGNLVSSLSGAKKHSVEIASIFGLCGGLGAITGDPAKYMEIITSLSLAIGRMERISTFKPFGSIGLTNFLKIKTLNCNLQKPDPSSLIRIVAAIVGSVVGTGVSGKVTEPEASGKVSDAAARGAMLGEQLRLLMYCITVLSSGDPSTSSSVAAIAAAAVFLLRHHHTEWSNGCKALAESVIDQTINSKSLPEFIKEIALYFKNTPPSDFEKNLTNKIMNSAYNVLPLYLLATTAGCQRWYLPFLVAIGSAVDQATKGQLQEKMNYLVTSGLSDATFSMVNGLLQIPNDALRLASRLTRALGGLG